VGSIFVIAVTRTGSNPFVALNLVTAITRMLCAECKTVDLTPGRVLKRYAQVYLSIDALVARGSLDIVKALTDASLVLDSLGPAGAKARKVKALQDKAAAAVAAQQRKQINKCAAAGGGGRAAGTGSLARPRPTSPARPSTLRPRRARCALAAISQRRLSAASPAAAPPPRRRSPPPAQAPPRRARARHALLLCDAARARGYQRAAAAVCAARPAGCGPAAGKGARCEDGEAARGWA
jgi:hypothetical protein